MDLGVNHLTGTIPTTIGLMTSVVQLVLRANFFKGTIPSELGYLRALRSLNLGANQLTGTIPPELGSLTSITETLFLSFNHLTGTVPSSIGSLVKVQEGSPEDEATWIMLNNNFLTGNVDPIFCQKPTANLEFLFLDCAGPNPKVICSCCTTCYDNED